MKEVRERIYEQQGHISSCMQVGNERKAPHHSRMYMNAYIYIYMYTASPIAVYMPTDLFSVRRKRKGSKAVRREQEECWKTSGRADSNCMHIMRWCASISVYAYYLVQSNLSTIVMS